MSILVFIGLVVADKMERFGSSMKSNIIDSWKPFFPKTTVGIPEEFKEKDADCNEKVSNSIDSVDFQKICSQYEKNHR